MVADAGHGAEQVEPLEREELVEILRLRERCLDGVLGSLESFVTVDGNWRVTFANAAALEMARRHGNELLGQDVRELAKAQFAHVSLAPLERALHEQVVTEFEATSEGSGQLFACTAYPLAGEGVAIYARDITEREREREARRVSEKLYRELVESVNSVVLRWNRDGVLTFINAYAVELFGWQPDEIVGGPVTVLIPQPHPNGSDLVGLDEEILAAPERYVTNVNENVTKDGRRLWMAWTNRALEDEQGEVREILAIGNDVTELVRAQAALRESEERYRTIVELADEDLMLSSGGTYAFQGSVVAGVDEQRGRLRAQLIALAAGARRHRLWTLIAALAAETAFLIPIGLASTSRQVLGLPGSLLTLTVVVTAVLAGWQAGLAAALAGGVIFWTAVADVGAKSAAATTLVSMGVWIAAALISGLLAEALRGQIRLRKSAAVALARAETLREREAERAAQEERTRIARDLHDSVTQSLFAATLKAEALTAVTGDRASGGADADDVLRLNRGALAQMRTLLLELRGDPATEAPLHQLLRYVAEAAESRASVRVSLALDEEVALPPEVHDAIYRITTEALNNIVRHARAQNAWVRLDCGASYAGLVIGDDGRGFAASSVDPGHLGLASMRERASSSGGHLVVTSTPGEGTAVTAKWRFEGPEKRGTSTGRPSTPP